MVFTHQNRYPNLDAHSHMSMQQDACKRACMAIDRHAWISMMELEDGRIFDNMDMHFKIYSRPSLRAMLFASE